MSNDEYFQSFRHSRTSRVLFSKKLGLSYSPVGRNLGDSWWVVNAATRLHIKTAQPVGIYTMTAWRNHLYSCKPLLAEVIEQLDLPYVPALIGDGVPPGQRFTEGQFPLVPTHVPRWPCPGPIDYFLTKKRPVVAHSKIFSYQIYGVSSRARQSFSRPYAVKMVTMLQRLGLVERCVGLPLTLAQSIDVMCRARFHVGIDSGMTHVARSVGIPIYVYQAKLPLDWIGAWHPLEKINVFRTIEELEFMLRRDKLLPPLGVSVC